MKIILLKSIIVDRANGPMQAGESPEVTEKVGTYLIAKKLAKPASEPEPAKKKPGRPPKKSTNPPTEGE